jgi:hypothetical protein
MRMRMGAAMAAIVAATVAASEGSVRFGRTRGGTRSGESFNEYIIGDDLGGETDGDEMGRHGWERVERSVRRESFVLRLLRQDGRSFRSMSRTKHHVRELEFEVEPQVKIFALKSY